MKYVKLSIFVLVPILLTLLLVVHLMVQNTAYKTRLEIQYRLGWVYVFSLVGIYWTFNILHVAAASFIILLAFPLIGTVDSTTLCKFFMSEYNASVLGSIILFQAGIECGLQKRLASAILKHSGGSMRWIAIYLYVATTWTAIWSNGGASTFFMLGVIDECLANIKAILSEQILLRVANPEVPLPPPVAPPIAEPPKQENAELTEQETSENVKTEIDVPPPPETKEENYRRRSSGNFILEMEQLLDAFGGELLYMVVVASCIGEFAWPFGNPMGFEIMKLKVAQVSQGTWFMFSFPLVIMNSAIAMMYLFFFKLLRSWRKVELRLGCITQDPTSMRKKLRPVFSETFKTLPRWNFREYYTVFVWTLGVLLCLTRDPRFSEGWGPFLAKQRKMAPGKPRIDIGDSACFIFMALMVFLLPSWGISVFKGPKKVGEKLKPSPYSLGWKKVQSTFPYGTLMYIGATGCIGRYSEKPMAEWVSDGFKPLRDKGQGPMLLKITFQLATAVLSFLLPSPGTSAAVPLVWKKLCPGNNFCSSFIFPVVSVLSLGFALPVSSVSTVIGYNHQDRKKLSAWYFIFVGFPLYALLLVSTILYSLLWFKEDFLWT